MVVPYSTHSTCAGVEPTSLVNTAIVVRMELTMFSVGEVVYRACAMSTVQRAPTATPSQENATARRALAGKSFNEVHRVVLTWHVDDIEVDDVAVLVMVLLLIF